METLGHFGDRKLQKLLNVRIPAWIDSVEDITGEGLCPDVMRITLHQFFLSYLKNHKLRKSKKAKNFLPDFFPVSSTLLRQTCTDNYLKYVNALIDFGVVERHVSSTGGKSYVVGGHAQLYKWRIPPDYEGGYRFRRETVSKGWLVKAVLRTRDRHMKECERTAYELSLDQPVYSKLFDFYNDIEFDRSLAGASGEYQTTDDIKFLEAEAIMNHEFVWFKTDSYGHRLHTPITTMPKEYRKYLRFKGHPDTPFMSLDIKNSQPYFSAVFMNSRLINDYLPEFIPLLHIAEPYTRNADFLLYRRLCVEGRLYEFIMGGMGLDTKDKEARDKIKKLFFSSVLFSKTRVYGENSRFREMFRHAFSSVHKMFQDIKHADEMLLPKLRDIIRPPGKKFRYAKSNNAYTLVACLMQRSEAALMYQVVAPRLIEKGIRFVTIHDSIMCLPDDAALANKIFIEAFDTLSIPPPTISVNWA
ncbi:MAG: hypothetical protein IPP77_05980 [Bacteroidetes bacterium]|nr:hypothetical protein [Bacteroidota bacterium]